jgi:hypothetical protein
MAEDRYAVARWAENLEELDREIARLATLCQVKIFEAGVIGRVLHKDAAVCGTDNPRAFVRLHNLVMVHLALREKSVGVIGQALTARVEDQIIERLKKVYPVLAAPWPPPHS